MIVVLLVVVLSVIFFCCYAECRYAECCCAECFYGECHYAEWHYAECPGAQFFAYLKTSEVTKISKDKVDIKTGKLQVQRQQPQRQLNSCLPFTKFNDFNLYKFTENNINLLPLKTFKDFGNLLRFYYFKFI